MDGATGTDGGWVPELRAAGGFLRPSLLDKKALCCELLQSVVAALGEALARIDRIGARWNYILDWENCKRTDEIDLEWRKLQLNGGKLHQRN